MIMKRQTFDGSSAKSSLLTSNTRAKRSKLFECSECLAEYFPVCSIEIEVKKKKRV